MSINAPVHYGIQFANTMALLLQQKSSKLESYVTSRGGYTGKSASPVDQVGLVEMQAVNGRFEAMPRVDAPLARRWVDPQDFDLPQLVDLFDKLREVQDPTSSLAQAAVAAANRQKDRLIIAAFFGTAKTGEQGATSTTFPAADQIAQNFGASANVNLTVAKVLEGRKKLMAHQVDVEADEIICAVTASQYDSLLHEAQFISSDFNGTKPLTDGRVGRYLGVTFVHCELLTTDTSGYRRVPMWAKSGMHLAKWMDVTSSVSQRNDLRGEPWQLYLKMTMGATRLEEGRVIEIKCAE